jgi:hypothetical protein
VDAILSVLEILVGLILLWVGITHLELETFPKAVISLLEIGLLAVGVWKLGIFGFILFVVVSVVAFLAWSIKLAMDQQSILTSAVINNRQSVELQEVEALNRRLRRLDAFKAVGPLVQARLIERLSQQGRSLMEIEAMAPIVAKLGQIYRTDIVALAPRFDRLLRLYGKEPADSEEVANQLVAATKVSAITFAEMVGGMLIAGGGQR